MQTQPRHRDATHGASRRFSVYEPLHESQSPAPALIQHGETNIAGVILSKATGKTLSDYASKDLPSGWLAQWSQLVARRS